MVDVIAKSRHIYTILNTQDIDWGAIGPDRTKKPITINCIPLDPEIKDDGTGNVFDYSAPVRIEAYVRDNKARGERREPQQLVKLEKDILEFLMLNRFGLINEGISNITVQNSQIREVDKSEFDLSNWFKLTINVSLQYRLKVSLA